MTGYMLFSGTANRELAEEISDYLGPTSIFSKDYKIFRWRDKR